MKSYFFLIAALFGILGGALISSCFSDEEENQPPKAGNIVTTYRAIPIYSNGDDYTTSHGKNYSADRYYYGQKWQCVEFVKRFYHDAFKHRMPSVWGHAKDFYNPALPHGSVNTQRGMTQFQNGGKEAPKPDDLLVFNFSPFGHVSVISAVRETEIEVVQQNIAGKPRQTYPLEKTDGTFTIKSRKAPIGWLRLPEAKRTNPVFRVEEASNE